MTYTVSQKIDGQDSNHISVTLDKLFKICESYDKYEELRSLL